MFSRIQICSRSHVLPLSRLPLPRNAPLTSSLRAPAPRTLTACRLNKTSAKSPSSASSPSPAPSTRHSSPGVASAAAAQHRRPDEQRLLEQLERLSPSSSRSPPLPFRRPATTPDTASTSSTGKSASASAQASQQQQQQQQPCCHSLIAAFENEHHACVRRFIDADARLQSEPQLVLAVRARAHNFVASLIRRSDVNVNASNARGQTALHWACANDDIESAQLLLEGGARVDVYDLEGNTPLHTTLARGSAPALSANVDLLLLHGADPLAANNEQVTALHMAAALGHLNALQALFSATVDRLLERRASAATTASATTSTNSTSPSSSSLSPAAAAAAALSSSTPAAHQPLSPLLRECMVEVLAHADVNGRHMSHFAAEAGQDDVLMWLFPESASASAYATSTTSITLDQHNTCADAGVSKSDSSVVPPPSSSSSLAASLTRSVGDTLTATTTSTTNANFTADTSARGDTTTPTSSTTRADNTVFSLPSGLSQPNVTDKMGATPLHYACENARTEAARLLLSVGGSVNATRADDEVTPLHLAAFARLPALLREMIEVYNGQVNQKNVDGFTPLMIAAQEGSLECVQVLLQHDADVDATNDDGATALLLAVDRQHRRVVFELLRARADPNISTSTHEAPLHQAAISGDELLCATLLAAGADVNYKNIDGWTATHIALQARQADTARVLMNVPDFDPHVKTSKNTTLAHVAALEGMAEALSDLLEHGVDVHVRDDDGALPIDYARARGHTECVAVLAAAPRVFRSPAGPERASEEAEQRRQHRRLRQPTQQQQQAPSPTSLSSESSSSAPAPVQQQQQQQQQEPQLQQHATDKSDNVVARESAHINR